MPWWDLLCERIASASLHGNVLAQAYGIPARYIQNLASPLAQNSVFKFDDYFLDTNQLPQNSLKFYDYAQLILSLLNSSFPEPPNFRQKCQELLDVFPLPDRLKLSSLPY